jgi:RNA polymerase sigma factor (sigma-70 family)
VETSRPPAATGSFAPTRWTLVLRARGESDEARIALSELCEGYYAPVQKFIGATVRSEEAARDLTQEFFARVLRGGAFDRVAPERGRFRSFLLGAVKHFLSGLREREQAQKRGGGQIPVPLETNSTSATTTTTAFDPPDPQATVADAVFDRQWAFTLLDRALQRLGDELAGAGKADHFERLKPWLTGAGTAPQSEVAARLGLSESAIKVAIHRLRSRFRELVKAEIAQTVGDPGQAQAELAYLVEVVARG